MRRYRDARGDAGVEAYETGPDWIRVRFKHGGIYVYDHASSGRLNVERMKELAASGEGLATFISKDVKGDYARRER